MSKKKKPQRKSYTPKPGVPAAMRKVMSQLGRSGGGRAGQARTERANAVKDGTATPEQLAIYRACYPNSRHLAKYDNPQGGGAA